MEKYTTHPPLLRPVRSSVTASGVAGSRVVAVNAERRMGPMPDIGSHLVPAHEPYGGAVDDVVLEAQPQLWACIP